MIVVFDGGMPGAGEVHVECASAVAGLVGKVLGFLQGGMEFFVGGSACCGNREGNKCVLLVEKVSGLLGDADCFVCMGFRGVRVCPGFAPREICEGFSFCDDRAGTVSLLECFFLCCDGLVQLCALYVSRADIDPVVLGDVG